MLLFLPLLMLLLSVDVFAVPANPAPREYTQSDGSTITVIQRGDEYFHYYADDNGKLLVLAEDNDFYHVKRDGDSLSLFSLKEETGSNPLTVSDLSDEDIKREFSILTGQGTGDEFKESVTEPVTLDRLEGERGDGKLNSAGGSAGLKTMPLVTIVVGFNDTPYKDEFVWSEKLFGEGDSLRNYYYEMSDHKFTFVPAEESCVSSNSTRGFDEINDGIIHVTLDRDHGSWGDLNNANIADLLQALGEAVQKAGDYMDFSRYDTNKNRVIDNNELGISFIVAGYNAAEPQDASVSQSQLLWPHQYAFYYNLRVDNVRIYSYIAISECEKYQVQGDKQEYPGVVYHELGHYLGLQDLYDSKYIETDRPQDALWKGYNIYLLSIMGNGNYATDRAGNYKATGFDAFSRAKLGWIEPQDVTYNGIYTLSSQESSNGYNVLRIPTERENEYYLLENRMSEGRDEGLRNYRNYWLDGGNYDPNGIVIWHIEKNIYDRYAQNNEINTADHCPAVIPLFPEGRATGDTVSDWQFSEYRLDFNDTLPNFRFPFFSSSNFEKVFRYTDGREKGLFLPLYGEGADVDRPDRRSLSGINIRFIEGPSRDIKVEISGLSDRPVEKVPDMPERFDSGEALSDIITEKDIEILNDPDASTVSKNELLSAVNKAIDNRVNESSTLSFNSALKGNGKNNDREYWVKISMNQALRYDGRKHIFSSKKKTGKSSNADINVRVFYCEKTGDHAASPPGDDEKSASGRDGWTEAAVKKVKIANPRNACFDFSGKNQVKGLGETTYISGIVLEDKELNDSVGKALNSAIKSMARKLKSDQTSTYSDGELSKTGLEETQLIIPMYPLFLGVGENEGHYNDGNGKENSYTVTPGTFNAEKGKLKGAKLRMKYSNGITKSIRLRFSKKKVKDFDTVVTDNDTDSGSSSKRLSCRGNYFGYIDYYSK